MVTKFFKKIILPLIIASLILKLVGYSVAAGVFALLALDGIVGMIRSRHDFSFSDFRVVESDKITNWFTINQFLYVNPNYYKHMENDDYNRTVIRGRQQRETGFFLFWFLFGFEFIMVTFANLFNVKKSYPQISFNQEMRTDLDLTHENYQWMNYIFYDNDSGMFLFA